MLLIKILLFILLSLSITWYVIWLIDPECAKGVFEVFQKKKEYDLRFKDSMFADGKRITEIINSCKTPAQLVNSRKLINFLRNKYVGKVDVFSVQYIIEELRNICDYKWEDIHGNRSKRKV